MLIKAPKIKMAAVNDTKFMKMYVSIGNILHTKLGRYINNSITISLF